MTSAFSDLLAPSETDFLDMAEAAFAALPQGFRQLCGNVVIQIADFADADTLAALEIEHPYELSGLYHGVDLTGKSVMDPAPMPDHVFLYRLPILLEWCERGDVTLGDLIAHVLVHEIGHHFGLSDDDMHAIEESVE